MQDRIRAGGATFVTISPQTLEKSKQLITEKKLTFPILRDEGNALAGRFNRLNQFPEDLKQIYLKFGIETTRNLDVNYRWIPAYGSGGDSFDGFSTGQIVRNPDGPLFGYGLASLYRVAGMTPEVAEAFVARRAANLKWEED